MRKPDKKRIEKCLLSAKTIIEAEELTNSSFHPFACGVLFSTLDNIAEECGIDFKSEDIRRNIKS